jgi:hypothetical protein
VFLAGLLCFALLAAVAQLGQAQEPQPLGASAAESRAESDVEAEALPPGVGWRQQVGVGKDNYRVQRRPGSGQPWKTLLSLNKQGNLWVKGPRLGLGGNFRTRLQRGPGDVLEAYVSNQRALLLVPHPVSPNLVGGHSANIVAAPVRGATIAGGGEAAHPNRVTDDFGTVGGGRNNQAGDGAGTTADRNWATVGGGAGNAAKGQWSTVSGGQLNKATNTWSTAGGGHNNTASGQYATVGGGLINRASGLMATVPGGDHNVAKGSYSFAAGREAKANHKGAFVWADSTFATFASERSDQFRVRANGGARFDVNGGGWVNIQHFWSAFFPTKLINTSTGAYLNLAGVWVNASDHELKENFAPVDAEDVLARLSEMSIQTWNSKAEDPSIRHMGPTAEDFYAAFGLGSDDKGIGTLDADGVALAAIQALAAENAALRQQVADLAARLAALEAALYP